MNHHFDAEHLAAFAEGSLSREERAAVEAHAADCPRCLELLAAMVRTDVAVPAAPRQSWRVPMVLRWGVPLLAGATALALWVNVRPQPATAPVPATIPEPASSTTPATQPVPTENKETERALSLETAQRQAGRSAQTKTSDAPAAARVEQQSRDTRGASVAQSGPVAAPLSESDLRELRSPAAPVPTVPPAATPPPAAAGALPNAAPVAAPIPDMDARFRTQGQSTLRTAVRNAPVTVQVVSPEAARRWRVVGQAIQQSIDGGKTWNIEPVPVQSEIVAGASPAPLVAWFVGRRGYILLTTATNQWRRVAFPESVDLTAVAARSDRDAEVTTSDGRVFATADGGQTWTRR